LTNHLRSSARLADAEAIPVPEVSFAESFARDHRIINAGMFETGHSRQSQPVLPII
jgi:hypothetical protein